MKKYIFAYIALAMSFIVSCSDDNGVNNTSQKDAETINFAPFLDNGSIKTRSAHSTDALAKGFVVGVYNTDYHSTSLPLKQRSTISYNSESTPKYSSSPTLYWDNVSADGHDVRLTEGTGAGSVKIWAANVAGHSCKIGDLTGTSTSSSVVITDEGKLDWIIDADQTSGSDKHDLLVADYITNQKATKNAIELCFHHAMTKITVNVIAGDGFATNEITNSNSVITLLEQNLKATVDLTKAVGDNNDTGMLSVSTSKDDVKGVTMHPLTTANSVGESKKANASFDAIVAEGKQINTTDQFGTIVIGTAPKTNTYKIQLDKEVLKAWNNGTEVAEGTALTLKHGVHYILNVTVKKQGIELTAVLAPWTTQTAEAVGQIQFTGSNTMITDANATAFNKPFTVYSKTTTEGATYTQGSAFVWKQNETGDKKGIYQLATNATAMYWNDNADARSFRAALYESATNTTLADATVSDGKVSDLKAEKYAETSDLIWGTSGTTPINPTTDPVNLLFKHALSQVTVKLATSTGDDKIDLTKVKTVQICGTQSKGGSMSLEDGTISLAEANKADTLITLPNSVTKASEEATNPAYATSETWLVLPQSIDNQAKILITMEDGSTFSANLSAIHKAAKNKTPQGMGQTDAAWLQGEKYEYTITITKSQISFVASVLEWTEATGAGNATMDWD